MLTFLLSKFERARKNIDRLKADCFWAFSKEWQDEIDKAIANEDGDRLNQLYEVLKSATEATPEEFPLFFLVPIPREIEDLFAKQTTKTDHVSLHYSLQCMTSAEQEKVVKRLIKFWHKRNPDAVPVNLLQWASIQDVVPHGAIADPVLPLPRVEPIFDKNSLNILLGVDTQKKPLYWTPNQETNGFTLVIGASGSGKTESLKAIANETHNYGIPVLIIDFHGDIALDCCKTITLSHTSACEYGINPLELDSLDPVNGGVFPQLQKLIESICAFNTSIGHKQKLNIEKYLAEAYRDKGISDRDPSTWGKTPPTFSDVIEAMEIDIADPEIPMPMRNDISSALSVVRSVFKHPVFSKPTRLDIDSLLSRSHRIDLSPLLGSEDIQFLVVDTLLRKIGCALSAKGHIPVRCSDRERYRFAVFMDEAHKFTSKSTNRKGIIDVYACELRKYGLMMCLGSQNLDHFSPDTISQVATKILLKLQSAESARFPANEFGLTVDAITKGLRGKGHGYLKRGSADAIEFQFTPMHKR
ncbi:ATP-binding protein [Phormidium tenue]|uniref:ATP-binding protein n=1 Tax=Phormidium tenue FACHB-1050 TaxID=2692857 RepID=A0ABR8CAI0_9CYAN|nr:ATP-binding protein [Phormidium tenue]MBD2316696.1 ATP-binding protein [Phormidium tenue FACHB-1050]